MPRIAKSPCEKLWIAVRDMRILHTAIDPIMSFIRRTVFTVLATRTKMSKDLTSMPVKASKDPPGQRENGTDTPASATKQKSNRTAGTSTLRGRLLDKRSSTYTTSASPAVTTAIRSVPRIGQNVWGAMKRINVKNIRPQNGTL